jgi:hypothetical protein
MKKTPKLLIYAYILFWGYSFGLLHMNIKINNDPPYREYGSEPDILYYINGELVHEEVWDTIGWWNTRPDTLRKTIRIYDPSNSPIDEMCEECEFLQPDHRDWCSKFDSVYYNWWYENQPPTTRIF